MSFFEELNRRNVFRVAIAYVVASWIILQAGALLLEIFDAPDSIMRVIVVLLVLGFIVSISFTWAFEVTPEGIKRESEVDREHSAAQQTAKRLDMLTIALVVVAVGALLIDRYMQNDLDTAVVGVPQSPEPDRPNIELAQKILEVGRLRDAGEIAAAFALASELAPFIQDESAREALWAGTSWKSDIQTEPPGARVLRQTMDAAEGEWEDLGTTPLAGVRFALDEGYRLRFELAGHRSVETLHSAVRDYRWGETRIDSKPVTLDRLDVLPEEMVRIPGFTQELVDFDDFFMDRFEVTNREFAKFVRSGGYESPEFWRQRFLKDGVEISWEDAMSRFVDRTGRSGPASWTGGVYPEGRGDYPVNGVSWYEAAAYAAFVGKRLPTIAHVHATRKYYLVDSGWTLSRSNLGGEGPTPVGYNRAMNTFGVYDLEGNVREWSWNETGDGARATMGGGWDDSQFVALWEVAKSSWDRDLTNGIRLIRTFDSAEKLARLREPGLPSPARRDLRNEEPVSDEEIEIYRRMYTYDPLPLNAEIVAVDQFEHWRRERIDFDLPYGERGGAYIYIPNHRPPPYESVIYWGGANVLGLKSIDREFIEGFNFIVRSGRVVVQPILKGVLDRDDESTQRAIASVWTELTYESGKAWLDVQVKWIKDVSRTIDYLETRDDIRSESYGFYGLSWGAKQASILLAVEDRIGPAVLNVGGLDDAIRHLPEADPLTFVRSVKNPVLMLNGQYDIVHPLETSQEPMYELLGTDPVNKKHYVAPAGHVVPREATVRETLDWIDRYLNSHKN